MGHSKAFLIRFYYSYFCVCTLYQCDKELKKHNMIKKKFIIFIVIFSIITSFPAFPDAAPGQKRGSAVTPKSTVTLNNIYNQSFAVIIGINAYDKWPSLEYAVTDARAMERKLKTLGFQTTTLIDHQATKENILKVLGTELPQKVRKNDRVVIFFAGHGQTEELADGTQMGHIFPVDTDTGDIFSTAISMDQVSVFSRRLSAKHVLYLIDSCHAGLGLTRHETLPLSERDFLWKITTRKAHQMLTAGGKGELAHVTGRHGVFTKYVLEALDGAADGEDKGFVTFSDIATYVRPRVARYTQGKQVPQYGNLDGKGEFIFVLAGQPPIPPSAMPTETQHSQPEKPNVQSKFALPSPEQASLNFDLFDAVRKGDLNQIKKLIDSGADPNARNEHDETPLMVAMLVKTNYDCVNTVDLFVLNGADVNLKRRGTGSATGHSALSYAANDGRNNCIQSLLDHGAVVNVEDISGMTPLIDAIHNRHLDTAKLLISRGASLDPSSNGISPLLMASMRGPTEMVEMLIDKGADIHIKYQGQTLISLVKSSGQRDKDKIIQLLRQKGVVE